jgi:threonine-phosphate decarboxylase
MKRKIEDFNVEDIARPEIRSLVPCAHGGKIWEIVSTNEIHEGKIVDFSSNVNSLGASPRAIEAIHGNLWRIPLYPDSDSANLKKALCETITQIGEGNIVIGNGSTELIYLFCDTFLEKGDRVLVPAPTFGEYEKAVRRAGGIPHHVRLGPDFGLHSNLFKNTMNRVKAIFLCNPNNPTSILAERDEVTNIIEEARDRNVLVFLDEDFMEFVEEKKRYSLIKEAISYGNVFVLKSFTKIYGLTGLRIGYGIASKQMISLLHKAKIPWNINCLAQVAAIEALGDREHLRKTRSLLQRETGFLLDELEKIRGLRVVTPDANFIIINIKNLGITALKLKEKMIRRHILIRDCSTFHGLDEYYIRLAVKTREENEMMLEHLKKIIEDIR